MCRQGFQAAIEPSGKTWAISVCIHHTALLYLVQNVLNANHLHWLVKYFTINSYSKMWSKMFIPFQPMRHRKLPVEVTPPSTPLACSVIGEWCSCLYALCLQTRLPCSSKEIMASLGIVLAYGQWLNGNKNRCGIQLFVLIMRNCHLALQCDVFVTKKKQQY